MRQGYNSVSIKERLTGQLPKKGSEMAVTEKRIGQTSTPNSWNMRTQLRGWDFVISMCLCMRLMERQLQNLCINSSAHEFCCFVGWLLLAWVRAMVSGKKAASNRSAFLKNTTRYVCSVSGVFSSCPVSSFEALVSLKLLLPFFLLWMHNAFCAVQFFPLQKIW